MTIGAPRGARFAFDPPVTHRPFLFRPSQGLAVRRRPPPRGRPPPRRPPSSPTPDLLRTMSPLLVDAYRRSRATGAFIVVDEATHVTAGAGLVIDGR